MHAIENWHAPPASLRPPERTLHLWRIDLRGSAGDLSGLLSRDEQQRADRFIAEQARTGFIRSRGAMRSILSGYLDTPPHALHFVYGDRGKPYLEDPPIPIHFNLSHAKEMALFAVATHPIGIDLEQLIDRGNLRKIAARMFPQPVPQAMTELQGNDLTLAFFRHWTHLESCAKCGGSGLFGPKQESRDYYTKHFIPEPGWISCVASTNPLADVSTWKTLQYS